MRIFNFVNRDPFVYNILSVLGFAFQGHVHWVYQSRRYHWFRLVCISAWGKLSVHIVFFQLALPIARRFNRMVFGSVTKISHSQEVVQSRGANSLTAGDSLKAVVAVRFLGVQRFDSKPKAQESLPERLIFPRGIFLSNKHGPKYTKLYQSTLKHDAI